MPYIDNDPEQMADDMLHDRRIKTATYCARCGYNLITLPKNYHCPECGSLYKARSPWTGIHMQQENRPPLLEFLGLIAVGIIAVFLILRAIALPTSGLVTTAIAFSVCTIILAIAAYVRTVRFMHGLRVARRIADQELSE